VVAFYSALHRGPPHAANEAPRVVLFMQTLESKYYRKGKNNYTAEFQHYGGMTTAEKILDTSLQQNM
jgi:hypothetical protein